MVREEVERLRSKLDQFRRVLGEWTLFLELPEEDVRQLELLDGEVERLQAALEPQQY